MLHILKWQKHSHHHHHDEGHEEGHHDEHHEGELPYEWAGVFDLKKGTYTWSFSKVEGKLCRSKNENVNYQS